MNKNIKIGNQYKENSTGKIIQIMSFSRKWEDLLNKKIPSIINTAYINDINNKENYFTITKELILENFTLILETKKEQQ